MRRVNPVLNSSQAYLLFSDPSFTSTFLYSPKGANSNEPSKDDALYTVSHTTNMRHVIVHRAATLVANIQFPSRVPPRKPGLVTLPGKGSIALEEWITQLGKLGAEQHITIEGEQFVWKQAGRDGLDVYPLLRGVDVVAVFVPGLTRRKSGERIWTRAHLEFTKSTLPDQHILDGIVASLVVTQYAIQANMDMHDEAPSWALLASALNFGG